MSWWNAKYRNDHGEYEIIFGSQQYEKAKAVEKVCCAVIDKKVNSPDDVEIVRHGLWVENLEGDDVWVHHMCSECKSDADFRYIEEEDWDEGMDGEWYYLGKDTIGIEERLTDYCPHCGAKMDVTDINVGNKGR